MGDMAVIARDRLPTAMGRVIPSGIIGLHDVAVDTGRRIVPNQIGMETHQIKEKAAAADKNARKDQQEYLLPKINNVFYLNKLDAGPAIKWNALHHSAG